MSDIVERLQSLADCDSRAGEPLGKCMREAAAALRLCQDYAHDLAVSLAAKHYPEVPQWEPLPDLLGLLTQIDNMTTGLERRKE